MAPESTHRPATPWRNWAGTEAAVATEVRAAARPRGAGGRGDRRRAAGNRAGARQRPLVHRGRRRARPSRWTCARGPGSSSADVDTGLVTVRAGTTLRALNAELDRLGLAMTNLGDIDAQTIAGAISTGTHGTGARFGGISTQVAGLELVLADGSVVSCSADERPDLFAAGRVGLGALGVITHGDAADRAVVRARRRGTAGAARRGARRPRRPNCAANDHFEFYWFPYGRNALTKRNNRLPAGTAPAPLSPGAAVRRVPADGEHGVRRGVPGGPGGAAAGPTAQPAVVRGAVAAVLPGRLAQGVRHQPERAVRRVGVRGAARGARPRCSASCGSGCPGWPTR